MKMEIIKKRYVATVDYYVWADNEEEALKKVENNCEKQRLKHDDSCKMVGIVEQKFGTLN